MDVATVGERVLPTVLGLLLLWTGLRWLSGVIAHVNATHELAERDNFAFGISLAGGTWCCFPGAASCVC